MYVYFAEGEFEFIWFLEHVMLPELVYTILVTLVLYQIILTLTASSKGRKNKKECKQICIVFGTAESRHRRNFKTRVFVLIIVFCIMSILVGRLFNLQIVNERQYLDDYKLQIQKTK